jgi:hypothetical protein
MNIPKPFAISARLLPALQIGKAWVSVDPSNATFWIDLPDGTEHRITDFRPGAGQRDWREWIEALLSFLGACAESRAYARRSRNGEPGEHADLFNEAVGSWAESESDELEMLQCEISEDLCGDGDICAECGQSPAPMYHHGKHYCQGCASDPRYAD